MDSRDAIPLLSLRDIDLTFHQGGRNIEILKQASADVFAGETVALLGQSGAGKSSLLHILGLLDRPNKGSVVLDGIDCLAVSDRERTLMRRTKIGFVYQFHHLLAEFTALENVSLPQLILGVAKAQAEARARQLLGDLGLSDRLEHRPGQLSGGEQQRVAIARAVANSPKLLLADEPTGNLDPKTAGAVFDQLLKLVHGAGLTVIIATHNLDLARRMSRTWKLDQGKLAEIAPVDI
ncbi:MAG: ABC transporter ATP-binding protein [Proteobacteria bacterium]|nr:ABC transporter ATP-binding protein [Pseudomonadota bacterium]